MFFFRLPLPVCCPRQVFDGIIYLLILCNGVLLVLQTYMLNNTSDTQTIYAFWVSYIFIGVYTAEQLFKILGNKNKKC